MTARAVSGDSEHPLVSRTSGGSNALSRWDGENDESLAATGSGTKTSEVILIDDSASPNDPDELITPLIVEDVYKVPRATQAKGRGNGTFCPYLKIGRSVYYRRRDLEAWLDSKIRYSTAGGSDVGER